MVQATTPTFVLTLPETVDLSIVDKMLFSLVQNQTKLTKKINPSDFEGQTVSVFLTQTDTLPFVKGTADLQLNWTYADGKRACSNIVKVNITNNLYPGVI